MRWRLLGYAVAVYVVINLIMVMAATVVTDLRLVVEVVDSESGASVPNASVVWGTESGDYMVIGDADASGRFEEERVVGFDPIWMFPKVGRVRFVEYELRVSAEGYGDTRLGQAFIVGQNIPASFCRDFFCHIVGSLLKCEL